MQIFWLCPGNPPNPLPGNLAQTHSAIASAFWRSPRKPSPGLAQTSAWMMWQSRRNVGPGTLYRHFPTRDALLEAVYRTEVEKLAAAQQKFAETMAPVEALRAWMLLFVDYIAAKQIIAPALNTLVGGPSKVYESTRDLIKGAIDALVKRAIESGDIRSDLDPFDLLRALIGVSNVASGPDWPQSAKRLVQILIIGSRPISL